MLLLYLTQDNSGCRGLTRRTRACRLLDLAEAVDQAQVQALVVLEGSAVGRAEVVGRDAEGQVGIQVVVEVDAGGEVRAVIALPHADIGGGEALGVAGKFAESEAAFGEDADGELLLADDAVAGASHEAVLRDLGVVGEDVARGQDVADLGVAVAAADLADDTELGVERVCGRGPEGDLVVPERKRS